MSQSDLRMVAIRGLEEPASTMKLSLFSVNPNAAKAAGRKPRRARRKLKIAMRMESSAGKWGLPRR